MSRVTGYALWAPEDLMARLETEAKENGRSLNDEIVLRLQNSNRYASGGFAEGGFVSAKPTVPVGEVIPRPITNGDPSKFRSGCLCGGGVAGRYNKESPTRPVFGGRLEDSVAQMRPRKGFYRINMLNGMGVSPNGTFFSPLDGQTWVLTGQIPGVTRDEARKTLMSYGAQVGGAVDEDTFAVVAGPGAGRKLTRAQELGVRIIQADEFVAMSKQFQFGEFPR